MNKYNCTKIDYCPYTECDDRYIKVPDYSFGKIGVEHGFKKIKGSIEEQSQERVKNVPEDVKKEFFRLMREGKNLGQAREATNLGLQTAGQLLLNQIEKHSFYSYKDPYTGEEQYDNPKLDK